MVSCSVRKGGSSEDDIDDSSFRMRDVQIGGGGVDMRRRLGMGERVLGERVLVERALVERALGPRGRWKAGVFRRR